MGNCLDNSPLSVQTFKSIPLTGERLKWKSHIPVTLSQLEQKRDEFWETAPAFDGRQEIWDALKAASEALLKRDLNLAQAIVNGANIILPNGSLNDCYDELGTHYQIPLYVLWNPTNMIELDKISNSLAMEKNNTTDLSAAPSSSSGNLIHNLVSKLDNDSSVPNESQTINNSFFSRLTRRSRHFKLFGMSLLCISNENDSCYEYSNQLGSGPKGDKPSSEELIALKLRLSTGDEFSLNVPLKGTILEAKQLVEKKTKYSVSRQRWCCSGKILSNKSRLFECNIPSDFIIQVIVHTPFEAEIEWLPRIKELQLNEENQEIDKEL